MLEATVCMGDYSKDLLTLCTRVNRKVAETVRNAKVKEGTRVERVWQAPEIYSRLTKDIYFNKKAPKPV